MSDLGERIKSCLYAARSVKQMTLKFSQRDSNSEIHALKTDVFKSNIRHGTAKKEFREVH